MTKTSYGMQEKRLEPSPFKLLEGRLVAYGTQFGSVTGIYHEKNQDGMYWMEFQPSLVGSGPNGKMEIIEDQPTIVTNFTGIMRPIPNKTLESIASEINEEIERAGAYKSKKQA